MHSVPYSKKINLYYKRTKGRETPAGKESSFCMKQ